MCVLTYRDMGKSPTEKSRKRSFWEENPQIGEKNERHKKRNRRSYS